MKRVSTDCEFTNNCSDQHAEALHDEFIQVYNDENIKRYINPPVSDMKIIIAEAENYSGEWYHSEIVVDERLRFTPEYVRLRDTIIDLGADNGIYITYESHYRTAQSAEAVENFLSHIFSHAQK